VVSFNLDEYVGLPGENAQQRALHPESYSYFMIAKLFSLLDRPFHKTYVPWGTLIDQDALAEALDSGAEFDLLGSDKGRAIVVSPDASGYLGWVRDEILDAYAAEIARAGGIDLHVVGVGGRGHVAFHESGIPFDASPVLLVKLDDNTVADAVSDAHFERVAPMERGPEAWTEFETLFRGKGLPIHAAAWRTLPAADDDEPLPPLTIAPEDEPREGIFRRESRGKEWREAQKYDTQSC
jgi:6-phosphogluconolactonase/glucosamine-6-phosphate isomerase/deaminase